jgi:hypothetical protein
VVFSTHCGAAPCPGANLTRGSARTIHAIEKGRPCRQATKRKILITLGVPWELRDEYFSGVRKVRRLAPVEEARSA